MKSIMSFFDYVFYRTYNFFDRKRDDIADEKATNFIVVLQCFILIDLFIIANRFIVFKNYSEHFNKWIWGGALVLIIGILGHMRYKKKFKEDNYSLFKNRWNKEETKIKIIKGWLIILFLFIIVFAIPITSIIK